MITLHDLYPEAATKPGYRGGQYADLRQTSSRLRDAIDRYGRTSARQEVASYRMARHHLDYANPYAANVIQRLLYPHFLSRHQAGSPMTMVTLLHRAWHGSDHHLHIDTASIIAKVRRELAGANGIFSIEAAHFENVRHAGGHLFAPHCQGICWGDRSGDVLKAAAGQFLGGNFGSVGVRQLPVFDLVGATLYSFKQPFRTYGVFQDRTGRFWHGERRLRLKVAYRLWDYFRFFGWPDFVFGIGEGVDIIKQIETENHHWYRLR